MLSVPAISNATMADFERDGFAVVRSGFDRDAMAQITAWAAELAARPEVSGQHWVYHEQSRLDPAVRLISRIEHFSPYHAGFREVAAVLGEAAARFLGEPAALFKEKINFKMPGGDGFKPHQDSQAGWGDYADYFITVMVCIDAATLANGCLRLVAGQQHRGLFREWEPLTDKDMAGMDFVPYPTAPGDLVFFDSYTPHSSEPNLTDSMRRIYFATYNRRSAGDHYARYHADKYRNYPPDIDRIAGKEYVFRV
jgi:ectoine hydroxylase-related dioxygenase (phytanoyl-CoA dioxygenase family)